MQIGSKNCDVESHFGGTDIDSGLTAAGEVSAIGITRSLPQAVSSVLDMDRNGFWTNPDSETPLRSLPPDGVASDARLSG